MQDATMPLPKMISRHLGIRTYEISDHQYLHPAELIDLMVEKTNVCETGVFIARLNVETLEENTVQAVKELARKDGDCKHFKPLLIKARARWPETGFYLVTSHDEGETPEEDEMLKVSQKDFIDSFVNHNFSTSPPTALEQVLHEEGIGPCIDKFYGQLRKKGNMIMYAANINPTEVDPDAPKLLTTANSSMYDMVSYIKYLKGGKHAGIVTPTLYVGSEGAPFACHREDMSCEAVNRHISGAPNIWFAVPPQYCNAFCNLLSKLGLCLGDRTCANFIQHKHAIVDPRIVVEAGIPVHTIIQKPGDIVYLLPNVIHFGFKLGCSISEAVNICSRTWALPGMLSLPRCHCPSVDFIYYNFDISVILEKIGVAKETRNKFQKGRLLPISMQLQVLHPLLHPELGKPAIGGSDVLWKNLLGPDIDADKLGKYWQRFLNGLDGDADAEIMDIEEDLVQDNAVGTMAVLQEVDVEAPDSTEDLPDRPRGSHRCPECNHDTQKYGSNGAAAVRSHVKACHVEKYVSIMEAYKSLYERKSHSPQKMECDACGKSYHGTGSFNRHIRSGVCYRKAQKRTKQE